MKNKNIQAIEMTLKPSLLLMGAISVISMLSCWVLLTLAIPLIIKCLMIAIVICSSIYYTLRDVLRLLPWSWQRIAVSSQGELRLTNQRGEHFTPALHATSFIHPSLIIINTKPLDAHAQYGKKCRVPPVLIFSAAGCQQHRKMRVWLRWWQHDVQIEKLQHTGN